MKFKRGFRDDDEPVPTSSMADITFLLIIFFMVTTVFNIERGIQMKLPRTSTQQEIKERNVVISIDRTQKIFINGEPVELPALGTTARGKLLASPEGYVLVKSDEGVPYRRVVDVLDELLQVGIGNIALPTEKEGK